MIGSFLSTKLHPPNLRKEIISRPYLLTKLEAGVNGKLILISAPAGFGKTTLLTNWVAQSKIPSGWLSVDDQDDDPERFIYYIIASLQTINIELDTEVLSKPKVFFDGKVIEFLDSIINQISISRTQFALVIDDYHLIQNQEIHAALIYILDHLPPNMVLVIGTRTDPPLRLARLRARGEMIEVRASDLRFTDEDAKIFFNQLMGIDLSISDLTTLNQKTEGWITGLQLAALSLQNNQDRHTFISNFAGDDRYIADFLIDEALVHQPLHIQNFLLETSILDHLSAPLCDAVTQREDSKSILAELERLNLFIIPLDNQREWYRYHHLFADLLSVRLLKTTSSSISELHSRASQWYRQNKLMHPAARHAIIANDIQLLEDIIQDNVLALLEDGESASLEKLLRSFQTGLKEPNLWVSIAHAWTSVFSGQVDTTEDALQNAEELISEIKPDKDQKSINKALGHISSIRAYICSLTGESAKGVTYAKQALEILPENDHSGIAYASLLLAATLSETGENVKAEEAAQNALSVCKNIPDSYLKIDAISLLSHVQHMQGQLKKSFNTIQEALDISTQTLRYGNRLFPIIGFAKIKKGSILYEWNKLDQAWEELNQGLNLIEKWGEKDSFLYGLMISVKLSEAYRNYDQAFKTIAKGLEVSRGLTYWFNAFDVLEAWMHAKHGKNELVDQWLNNPENPINRPPTIEQDTIYRHLIEILLLRGDLKRAKTILDKYLPIIEETDASDRLIRALILHANILLDLNKVDDAVLTLSRALDLAQPEGYIRVFIDGGEAVARLLFVCVEREIHPEYCSKILDEFNKYEKAQPPADITIDGEFIVEPLSSRELEVLQHIADGLTNQEIGQKLHLSLFTVKSHARNIFTKLGVKNRTEAVARARLSGML